MEIPRTAAICKIKKIKLKLEVLLDIVQCDLYRFLMTWGE